MMFLFKGLKFNKEKTISYLFMIVSITTILILGGIFLFLFFTGIKTFHEISINELFLGTDWNPTAYGEPSWGILSLLVGTLIVTLGALIFAIPLGMGASIYLAEIASPKTREFLKPTIELIAGIPSVVNSLSISKSVLSIPSCSNPGTRIIFVSPIFSSFSLPYFILLFLTCQTLPSLIFLVSIC